MAGTSPWLAEFNAALDVRHQQEVAPHVQLMAHVVTLQQQRYLLASQAAESERQVASLRQELAAVSAAAAGASASTVARLQGKLLELQDTVTQHYKTQAEGVRERLELSQANQRLKDEAARATAEAARAVATLQAVQAELAAARRSLDEREGQLAATSGELLRVRAVLDDRARECEALRAENAQLTDRVVSGKLASVAEMNEMNALLERLRKERDRTHESLRASAARVAELEIALSEARNDVAAADARVAAAEAAAAAARARSSTAPSPELSDAWEAGGVAAAGDTAAPPHAAPATALPTAPAPPGGAPVAAKSFGSWLQGVGKSVAAAASHAGVQLPIGLGAAPGGSTASASATGGGTPGKPSGGGAASAGASTALGAGSLTASVAGLVSEYVFANVPLPSRPHVVLQAHKQESNAVRFHESSRLLASAGSDGSVALLDPIAGTKRGALLTSTEGNSVLCVDLAGTTIVGGCTDRSVCVWDLGTQRIVRSLTGHVGKVHSVIFVPPTGSSSSTSEAFAGMGASGAAAAAGGGAVVGGTTFARGALLTAGSDRVVKLWDMRDGRCVRSIDTKSIVNCVALTPDGALLAVGNQDAGVRLFDVRTGGKVAEAIGVHSSAVTCVAFSRGDGGISVLSASRDNTLRLLDGRTLEPVHMVAGASSGAAVGVGAGIAARLDRVGAASGATRPDDTTAAAQLVMRHTALALGSNTCRAALSPNNQYAVVGGTNGFLYAFNTFTGEFELDLGNPSSGTARKRARKAAAAAAGGAPGGGSSSAAAAAAFGGGGGGTLAETLRDRDAEAPHGGACVLGVDWSLDGRYVASGDERGRVVVWTD